MIQFKRSRPIYFPLFLVVLLASCETTSSLEKDAISFCQIHHKQNWRDIAENISVEEFNEIVEKRTQASVNTKEFIALISEMRTVRFYKEMYPTVKQKIEVLTEKEWNCPEYESFYRLSITREPDLNLIENLSAVDIVITKQGGYTHDGKQLLLDSNSLRSVVHNGKNIKNEIIIKLEEGASEQLLTPLMNVLSEFNVQNVKVLSE